jgi:hypothetical protein
MLSMATLPTAGTLTAGATSSAAQVQGAPVASGSPSQIIVFAFATSTADVTLNQGLGGPAVRELHRRGPGCGPGAVGAEHGSEYLYGGRYQPGQQRVECSLPAARETPVTGSNTLIVDGAFTDISEGNRLRRMVIGLGVGASVVDTQVGLYQYANGASTQLLTFTTHADSGKMPGAGITGPAGQPQAYLTGQSAKQIVSQANNYFSQQGWSPTAS